MKLEDFSAEFALVAAVASAPLTFAASTAFIAATGLPVTPDALALGLSSGIGLTAPFVAGNFINGLLNGAAEPQTAKLT